MTPEQILKEHEISERINSQYGKLTHCDRCKGKGFIDIVDEKGYHRSIDCQCKPREEEK